MNNLAASLGLIRTISDYPKPGVEFRDITPLLADGSAFVHVVDALNAHVTNESVVAGVEARGFIFASAMAARKGIGFVPIRKAGKLPYETFSRQYGLEYGSDVIEVHTDAFINHKKVVLVDDVLATGGTLSAALDLIEEAGGEASKIIVLLEISSLGGRERILAKHPHISIETLVTS